MKGLLADISPLRESPAFRRLWIGSGLSAIGNQMTLLAVTLQVFTLTHSSMAVGAIGLFAAAPAVALALVGGTIGDVIDRRKLVFVTTSCQTGISLLFLVQAVAGVGQLWFLYLLVAAQFLLGSLNVPAARTFVPRLVPKQQLFAAAALRMFTMHMSLTVGPALAGFVAGSWGLQACYMLDVLSFAGALYAIARLPAMPPESAITRPDLRAVADGMRFIRGNSVVMGALLADLSVTLLGVPTALFPSINAYRFGGSAQTLGLFMAAPAIGGLISSAFSGPIKHVSRPGRAMLIGGGVWGVAIAAFGLASSPWVAVGLLVIAGATDALNVVFRTAMVQRVTPDVYRGRVSAVEYVVGNAGPQLGNFRAGAVGTMTSPMISAVAGGMAAVAGIGLIGLLLPAFVHYQAHRDDVAGTSPGTETGRRQVATPR